MHRPWPSEAIYTLNVILHFPSPVKILQRKQFSKEIATLETFKANVNHVSICTVLGMSTTQRIGNTSD